MAKKRRLTKSAKIWQDEVETLRANLDRLTARLDRLVKGAARLRAEAEPALGASGEARYEASRRMGEVESAAERVANAAERVALAVTFRTESERAERKLDEAERICRADYYADVRGVAEDFIDRWQGGDFRTRDEAIEWLDQGVDGHQRVIYPYYAQQCLLYSDNSGAYASDFGSEGVFRDGEIQWGALAYAAFRADIMDRIGAEDDVDVNGDPPEKVTDHDFVECPAEDREALEDAVKCDEELPCAHRDDDGEFDCGKGKRLHRD